MIIDHNASEERIKLEIVVNDAIEVLVSLSCARLPTPQLELTSTLQKDEYVEDCGREFHGWVIHYHLIDGGREKILVHLDSPDVLCPISQEIAKAVLLTHNIDLSDSTLSIMYSHPKPVELILRKASTLDEVSAFLSLSICNHLQTGTHHVSL
ncbi:LADA_0C06568g1_1 [Lachancea dasiensis]|uniref:LADA_0C06568g1_1 n=1 Tax=Lachancea dasiensis TaxID=1072105 RepID=A0A1G4IZA0_9SACH|nr:LADA_0C06568g1_1 [Lachancea dasiensis]